MPLAAPPPAALSARRFAPFAWSVLLFNLAVVLWGAYVRATGSGAGCGNHWPLCNGVVLPPAPTLKTIIEFTHRITSGLDSMVILVLLVWALRAFPPKHPVRLGAVLSFLFLITEALLGAGLVKFEHVASNVSIYRAYSLSLHLMNTLTLLACVALTAWWASGRPRMRLRGPELWRALPSLVAFILMGVSGVLAALGDTLFPSASLAEGLQQDLAPAVHLFVRLRVLHPFLAVAGGMWLLFDGMRGALGGREHTERQLGWFVAVMVVTQLLAGVLNLLLLAPVWLQLVHLLLADLLWLGVVLLAATRLGSDRLSVLNPRRSA